MEILILIGGIAIGLVVAMIVYFTQNKKKTIIHERLKNEMGQRVHEEQMQNSALKEQNQYLKNENEQLERKNENIEKEKLKLTGEYAIATEQINNLKEKLEVQKSELTELNKKYENEFKVIANKLLKENAEEFTHLNQKNIHDILTPLKEKIEHFEKTVNQTYTQSIKDQTDLRAELKKLFELNQKISTEAGNLTRALKADVKKQGNWGELILEKILEQSGLEKGREYVVQERYKNIEGKYLQPDVIINLPDEKHLIVDAKVSLVAYDQYTSETEDEAVKSGFLKRHIESIKKHIKELSEKDYAYGDQYHTPDFVLLFMPLESAFVIAMKENPDLFYEAWNKKIVMVSPTTLLATLKTVASIWKYEKQTQYAMQIADESGAMLDKFYSFLSDMANIEKHIKKTEEAYIEARKKLETGRGNLIARSKKIESYGANTRKRIPDEFSDNE